MQNRNYILKIVDDYLMFLLEKLCTINNDTTDNNYVMFLRVKQSKYITYIKDIIDKTNSY